MAAICYVVCAGVRANSKNVAEKYIFLANISLLEICFVLLPALRNIILQQRKGIFFPFG